MASTRTNFEIDDDVHAVMRRYGVTTKSQAVAIALRSAALTPMSDEEFMAMEGAGAIKAAPADVPPSE